MTRYSISRDHLSKKSPTVETCLFNRHFPRFTSIPSTSTRDKNILRYGHLPPTPKWHRDRHPVTATGRARALLLRALRVPDPPSAATNTIRARLLALRRPSVETAATGAGAGAAAIVEVEARVVVAAEVVSVVIEAEVVRRLPGAPRLSWRDYLRISMSHIFKRFLGSLGASKTLTCQ